MNCGTTPGSRMVPVVGCVASGKVTTVDGLPIFKVSVTFTPLAASYLRISSSIHHGLFLRGNETPQEAQTNLLDRCAQLLDVSPDVHSIQT